MVRSTRTAGKLAAALQAKNGTDSEYWSYKRMAQRSGLHGIIRYPAMMVPRMQADVLDAVASTHPGLTRVLDPFVGSGTTLVEAVRRGMSFEGYDINPLAILICRAKLLSLSPSAVQRKTEALVARLESDRSQTISVDFPGRDKWFTHKTCVGLSRLRRAIADESNMRLRQFFWVVFSETIRQTSLSRESTYKLHIRPKNEAVLLGEPVDCFKELASNACTRYYHHSAERGTQQRRSGKTQLRCLDIRKIKASVHSPAQLLLTSPPYGDNQSTIPYGQFSYLALSWIPNADLEGNFSFRDSAYAIDTASLGGSTRNYMERAALMAAVLPSFKQFFDKLCVQRRSDLEAKAASFTADFFDAVGASLGRLEQGGIAAWTLGDRCIGGIRVPLVDICREINQFFDMSPIVEIPRQIHSKRMPHRTAMGATMAKETLLVMTKI
ncbi:hypothetical protein [Variovorax sp. RA8]|uniref:hypothetical protein n=1 Tax=Variovorax sp. (strain JCM 16519 / RA8) TaxID=662548 RepID=UPI0013A56394|nr:hypothetical protein [Variovorax sp. RA8]